MTRRKCLSMVKCTLHMDSNMSPNITHLVRKDLNFCIYLIIHIQKHTFVFGILYSEDHISSIAQSFLGSGTSYCAKELHFNLCNINM